MQRSWLPDNENSSRRIRWRKAKTREPPKTIHRQHQTVDTINDITVRTGCRRSQPLETAHQSSDGGRRSYVICRKEEDPTHAICEGSICRIIRQTICKLEKSPDVLDYICKTKAGAEDLPLKTTTSLFAGVLVIAQFSRKEIDLEEVICTHVFTCTNRALMQPDGSVHTTTERYSDPPAGEHKADGCEHDTERYYPYLWRTSRTAKT